MRWSRLKRSCASWRRRPGLTQARDRLRGGLNWLKWPDRLNRGPVGRPWLRVWIPAGVAGSSFPASVVTLAPRTRRRDGRQRPFLRTRVALRAARGGRQGLVGRQVIPELVIRYAAEGLGGPHFLVDVGPLTEAHPPARPGHLGRVGWPYATGPYATGPYATGPGVVGAGVTRCVVQVPRREYGGREGGNLLWGPVITGRGIRGAGRRICRPAIIRGPVAIRRAFITRAAASSAARVPIGPGPA